MESVKRGRRILYCRGCDAWVVSGAWLGVCARCGEPPAMFKCGRCGHEWVPRRRTVAGNRLPKVCPACRSPYWCRERVLSAEEGR